MADVEEPKSPSNEKKVSKGKAPAVKRTLADVPKVNTAESVNKPVNNDLNNDLVMECLKSIQETQLSMVQRIMAIKQGQASFFEEGDYYEYDEEDPGPLKILKPENEGNTDPCAENCSVLSRFSSLASKFKMADICGEDVDPVLAAGINELYSKGMEEELYEKMVKDENCPRPGKCEGLCTAKMNKLVSR
ncbi:hypothetical protein DPMN_042020 [Dreissena polymorpha]|uniref:Uncharacterized protein n=1 Tax=Dreissena polymorpha TaxID=45954 RepID=A0A9D4HWK0_DREPO|nr:hypothetical protein DPMN_042020 [Dreissena polymorpha]